MATLVRDRELVGRFGVAMYAWAVARLSLGAIFLWAFFDKLFGLGFATQREDAWINGGSPTFGFLTFGTHGPLQGLYADIAGNAAVDWVSTPSCWSASSRPAAAGPSASPAGGPAGRW